MSKALFTAAIEEPVSIQQAKDNLRYTESDEDSRIAYLIMAAREYAEVATNHVLMTSTWDYKQDWFPIGGTILLPVELSPIQSVTSIKYTDTSGVQQTWPSTNYKTDLTSMPARITPAFGESFPGVRSEMDAVVIRIVAGYSLTADLPNNIQLLPAKITAAILMLVNHWFEHPDAVTAGAMIEVPMAVDSLLTAARSIWID